MSKTAQSGTGSICEPFEPYHINDVVTVIHPTYDPKKRVWCTDTNPPVTAPTIRELLTQLPPGTLVKDYYPNGDTPLPPWPKTTTDTRSPQRFTGPKSKTVFPKTNYRTQVDTEKEIARLLSTGSTRREVCDALHVKMTDVMLMSRKIDGGVK